MHKLFIQKSIEIKAPAQVVWDVLTKREYTGAWVPEFGIEGGYIDSTWEQGSPVLWKDGNGTVMVTGEISNVTPYERVHFTVMDVGSERAKELEQADWSMDEQDGITYTLSEHEGTTTLSIVQGDFSKVPNGQKYYDMTVAILDKVFASMKELAESATKLKA